MGCIHSGGKGISSSSLPYKRTPPRWLKTSSPDKGLTPSQIGVILRDSHGIAQVKTVTGSKILRILKAHGISPEIPEDLYHLIKKEHEGKDSKFRLILVESRIHRLARYYKRTKKLPRSRNMNLQLPVLLFLRLDFHLGRVVLLLEA
ncbi:hypothetical protein MKW98_000837 [Papaver atlanticum]|uniref:Small ribosomal subunit protein uS15 N-terminal domain-containing protein n=1 Tax=Papaver atlanticum TaxID=357466 RepID=A0AAD4SDZ7_9MAGN|nr:hypothetical protein MKW98_000837 [Papaver atlanticum]